MCQQWLLTWTTTTRVGTVGESVARERHLEVDGPSSRPKEMTATGEPSGFITSHSGSTPAISPEAR